jgi:hypothetical protein
MKITEEELDELSVALRTMFPAKDVDNLIARGLKHIENNY